jgi:hypothetical protein
MNISEDTGSFIENIELCFDNHEHCLQIVCNCPTCDYMHTIHVDSRQDTLEEQAFICEHCTGECDCDLVGGHGEEEDDEEDE